MQNTYFQMLKTAVIELFFFFHILIDSIFVKLATVSVSILSISFSNIVML